jgi:hypothetical protein
MVAHDSDKSVSFAITFLKRATSVIDNQPQSLKKSAESPVLKLFQVFAEFPAAEVVCHLYSKIIEYGNTSQAACAFDLLYALDDGRF